MLFCNIRVLSADSKKKNEDTTISYSITRVPLNKCYLFDWSQTVILFFLTCILSGIFGAALGLFHAYLQSAEIPYSMGIINSVNKVSNSDLKLRFVAKSCF